ncbi:MAG: siroheme synthase CysG [Planctomycetota bacterium]
MFPIMLDLNGRRCLVVGGGGVALRKVDGLRAEGAVITVVATKPMPALEKLASEGAIRLERRPYLDGEVAGFALVFAATDDQYVNSRVFCDAEQAGVWANVADDPVLCSFHLPARVQRGTMQLAIASDGGAPFATRRLRQLFEKRFGPEWAEWMDAAVRFRRELRKRNLPQAEAERRYDAFFAATVDSALLTARVPTSAEETGFLDLKPDAGTGGDGTRVQHPTTKDRHWETARPAAKPGLVSLVGAGPGDPGLLTVRGRERCLAADTIVYDRLAATALPTDLPPQVELHGVGKQAGRHPVPQEEINALLVRLAREGKRVVRLKGGDPYVFGRGGEEAEELVRAGVPFEIVPCVTAGIAVPAYAGIPVTHRREAVRVTIVTAHETIKSSGPQVRWDLVATDPHTTILGYMGVHNLPDVVEKLLAAGMDAKTPAAMIERGTTSGQRVVRSTVADLHKAVTEAGLKPPGLFVIGQTVRHADHLDWFGSLPLSGERLIVDCSREDLASELDLAGAEVVGVPLPLSPAARVVIGALPITGCILRDANEVESIDEERDASQWGPEVVAWCLGPRALGWQAVEELAASSTPPEIVAALAQRHGLACAT